MTSKKSFPRGTWVLIGVAVLLNIFYLVGQTMAIVNYEFTVGSGLQESAAEITEIGVAMNKGFGFGDTFFYIPLFIIGILGLLRKKTWGFISMSGALAVTVYWPMVCLSMLYYARGTEGWHFNDYTTYTVVLSLIALYGLWGMFWLFRHRHHFLEARTSR